MRSQFWTAPNQLTLLRLIFIPFVIISVFDGNWEWALGLIILAGLSDALDGLLARALNQRTVLGQYLDPIADKMLLSSLFLVLSFVRKIPWKYTVAVFSRDAIITVAHLPQVKVSRRLTTASGPEMFGLGSGQASVERFQRPGDESSEPRHGLIGAIALLNLATLTTQRCDRHHDAL